MYAQKKDFQKKAEAARAKEWEGAKVQLTAAQMENLKNRLVTLPAERKKVCVAAWLRLTQAVHQSWKPR